MYKLRKWLVNDVFRTKNLGPFREPIENLMLNTAYYNIVQPIRYGLRGYNAVKKQFGYGESSELNSSVNRDLSSDFGMSSSKKRKADSRYNFSSPSSISVSIPPSNKQIINGAKLTGNGHQVVKASSKKSRRRNAKLNLMDLLMPKISYTCSSYGHETYIQPDTDQVASMKYVAWPDGDQDIRQMCFLPSLYKYAQVKDPTTTVGSAVFYSQPGEQLPLDEFIRKSLDVNVLANLQKTVYPNGFNQIGLYATGNLPIAAPDAEQPMFSGELDQSFQMLAANVEHTFTNCGESVITLEIWECIPRKIMIGATTPPVIAGAIGTAVNTDPVITNDPLGFALSDNIAEFNNQTLPTEGNNVYGAPAAVAPLDGYDPANYNQNDFGIGTNSGFIGGSFEAYPQKYPVGTNTGLYTGTDHFPPCRPGVCDPQFTLSASQSQLNYNYKVTKGKTIKLNPGGKLIYNMELGSFAFSRSQWNEAITNSALSGTDFNTLPIQANLIPMFSRFLVIRARGETGFKTTGPNQTGAQVGYMGGAYTHTQREYYKCRSVFYAHMDGKFKRNNITDGWSQTLSTPIFKKVNDQSETIQNPTSNI